MSDSGGTDNPAFNNSDEYNATSTNLENSQTENLQQEQKDKSLPISNGHSFVSKHYVEPSQNTPEAQYKTETRIEVPTEDNKTSNTIKTNGINGNGNNNDLSFLNSSITSGQINDGKKEQIEAVNLELVSMRPYTGNNLQTKGQEACEIPSDPYEEYFVPVNEHRKYIRGEKLYVTKDKRSKSSYWRRIACWGFGLSVLAVALIIAILAGTGVILTQEATQPLDNEHQRSLDDVNAAGSQEFIKNPPSSPPPETSTFPPWRTTDETMLKTVPNALEGSIWLDNLMWNDDLMDVKTRVYRDVASEIEDNLSNMIDTEGTRTMIKIYNITKHGQVMFRIGNPPVIQPDLLQGKIEKMLRQNGNMIGKYHLSRMHVKHLIDECQYENLNCSELCQFDYAKGIFACGCLPGKMLDALGVNCIDESDLSNIDMVAEEPKSTSQEMIQGRGRAPEQSFEPEGDHDHWMHHHYHYDNEQSFTDSSIDKKDETSLKTMLTMNDEPKYELNPSSEPNDEPKSQQEEISKTVVRPTVETKTTPDFNFESKFATESTFKPHFEESTPEIKISSNVDPLPEEESTMIPSVEPETNMEMDVKHETEAEMTLKSTTESKLISEPATEHMESHSELETTVSSMTEMELGLEATSEMNLEEKSHPEPTMESHPKQESNSEESMNRNPQMKFDQESMTVSPVDETSTPMLLSEITMKPESTTKLMTESTSQLNSETTPVEPKLEEEPTLTSVIEPEFEPEPSLKPVIMIDSEEKSHMPSSFEPIEPEEMLEEPKSMTESNMSSQEIEYHPELNSEMDSSIPFTTKTTMMSSAITENPPKTTSMMSSAVTENTPKTTSIMSSDVTENISKTTLMSDIADVTKFVPDEVKTTSESIVEFNPESRIEQESTMKSDIVTQFSTTEMDEKVKSTFDSVTQSELTMNMDGSTTSEPTEKHMEPEFNFMTEVKSETSTIESSTVSDVEPETTEKLKLSTEMAFEVTKDVKSNPEVTQSFFVSPTMEIMNATEASSEFPLPVIPLGIKPELEKHMDDLTNMTETSTTMIPETVDITTSFDYMSDFVDDDNSDNQTKIDDSNLLHPVDFMNTTHMLETTEEIIQDKEHSIKPEINSTHSWMNNDTNIPPELIPEKIDPYVLIRNAFKTSTESVESTTVSVMHELESSSENTNEKLPDIPTAFEEKHFESMSPFLPEIIREKETKKAPRLDKDEQDFPNPFEPHVEDVIIHHQITMTPPADVNGTEFTDVANKSHLSHDAYQTETSHQENMDMTETTTTTNSPLLMTQTDFATTILPEIDEEKIENSSTDNIINHTTDKNINDTNIEINDDMTMNMNNSKNNESMEEMKNITNIESTTYMDEEILETTTARMMMSTEAEPSSVTLINDDDSPFPNKDEDNALEDQYNDIIEERISKKIDDTSNLRKKNFLINKLNGKSTTFKTFKTTPPMEMSESTTLMEDNMSTEKLTTIEMTTEKPKDDSKLTTEIPIMPVEIQQDISTTEVVEKTESSMINHSVSMVVDSPKTIFYMSMLEAKTTAQIPILPEELLTTEMSTTEKMSNESEFVTTQAIETSTASFESIKPVSEVIIDDAEPEIFDHTHFFRTTDSVPLEKDEFEDIPEEKLKIIPLDVDETTDVTNSTDHLTMNVTETPSTMQTIFILNDMPTKPKENIFIPKLKITEITSASHQPPVAHNNNQTTNATGSVKIHSATKIIPVYENIEDDVENPMIKPLHPINSILQVPNLTINQNTAEKNMTESTSKAMTATSPMTLNDNYYVFSKCTAGQFQCINGTSRDGAYCVSLSSKCDSENDCSDASDEINCEIEGCPGNFQCKSGQCLGRHLVCNGIADCDDGSDEDNCQNWTCLFDEFKCPNGRCIPDLWRCNGRPDCEDHRDEYSCSKSCSNDEYLCPSENWCVPQTWRCNGIEECINGEDEKLCDCGLEQFKCETGGCIALQQVCDGINHCPDHSDEWDCLMMNMTLIKNTTEEDIETQMPVGQPVLLKIKHNDGDRHLVCSDNWMKNHSDIYCQSLGYFGSEAFETMKYEKNEKQILRLKDNYDITLNLVGNLELSDRCESNEFVKISCQEFTCGSSENEGPTARLIGGTPAGDGQWSSVALLKETKSGVVCTASVLGPLHALASYSCIHKHRQSSNWEMLTGRELQKSVKVKNIIPYPQVKYNQFLYNDDIALIQLETPLILSRNLSAICLPNQQFQPRALCVTAGWGFPTSGEVNLKLKFLPVPIYNTEKCNATSHYAGFITKSNICAGFTGTDKGTCYNDEGAPLICASETGQWELQGLLSHHSRCSRDHPAIYSSLTPVISWLQHSVPALQMRI
ncbi:uncharacterized protein [Chelonus insularis]|uniref:uncharacterized protein isoform X2 n=1 Tax=Chelonus insularis TaxID=460826 RepID=UPI00158B4669|nr:uncharacterized protein LOC118065788 isoform X2 [Chelonus insularis]